MKWNSGTEFLPSLKTRKSLQSAAYLSGKYQTNNCPTVSRPLLWISVVLFPLCRCYLGFDSISCCSHYIIPCFTSKPVSANAGNRLVHVWTSLLQYQKVVPRVISALESRPLCHSWRRLTLGGSPSPSLALFVLSFASFARVSLIFTTSSFMREPFFYINVH